MKRLLTILMTVMLGMAAAAQEELQGRWWLAVVDGVCLPINLTFQKTSEGDVVPLFYSPMQSEEAIEPSSWSFVNDTLRFHNKRSGLKFTLCYNRTSDIFEGGFKQGLGKYEMTMKPSAGLWKLVRPQEPKSAVGYSEKEVTVKYRNKKGETIVIAGTLALPDGSEACPAAVLVSGSGQQNRDEELMGHKPFKVLADYLARHGVATLRYDDRGVGGSTGDVKKATTKDFAEDAGAVMKWLRKQEGIDSKKVGIIGHSEGGTIGPMVAAENRGVAFVVMMAGPGCGGDEILLQQNEAIYFAMGVEKRLVEVRQKCLKAMFGIVKENDKTDGFEAAFKDIAQRETKTLSKEEKRTVGMTDFEVITMAQQMSMPWMQAFVQMEPKVYLQKQKQPVLALYGEKDKQVLAEENSRRVSELVPARWLTVKTFAGKNHLFQNCESGIPSEYITIEETMAEDVLATIVSWILENTSKK